MSFCPTPCPSTSILNKLLQQFNVCEVPSTFNIVFAFLLQGHWCVIKTIDHIFYLLTQQTHKWHEKNHQVQVLIGQKHLNLGISESVWYRYIQQISHFVIPEQRCCFLFDRTHNTDKYGSFWHIILYCRWFHTYVQCNMLEEETNASWNINRMLNNKDNDNLTCQLARDDKFSTVILNSVL